MRINTKTQKIELLKSELITLTRAMVVSRTLSKHADGDIARLSESISEDISRLKTALAEQGKEQEIVNAPY